MIALSIKYHFQEKLKKVNEELQKIFNDREEQYKSMKEVVATGNNNRNNK